MGGSSSTAFRYTEGTTSTSDISGGMDGVIRTNFDTYSTKLGVDELRLGEECRCADSDNESDCDHSTEQ